MEPVTYVDPFYSWTTVEEHWRGDVYGQGTPPGMLLIGTDPGGLEVLLSVRSEDRGTIFCWIHSRDIWGTDGNDRIWRQAPSFEAFIDSLYDEPDGSDFENWRIPDHERLARPLVF